MGSKKAKKRTTYPKLASRPSRAHLAAYFFKLADEATKDIHEALADAIAEVDKPGGGGEDEISGSLFSALSVLYERRGYRNAAADIRESADEA